MMIMTVMIVIMIMIMVTGIPMVMMIIASTTMNNFQEKVSEEGAVVDNHKNNEDVR